MAITNRVASILPPLRRGFEYLAQQALPWWMHRAVQIHQPGDVAFSTRLKPGERVRVRSGLMEGVEGTVLAPQGSHRVVIAVDLAEQTGVSLEIDEHLVEILE